MAWWDSYLGIPTSGNGDINKSLVAGTKIPVATPATNYNANSSAGQPGFTAYNFAPGALENARWDKNDINWRNKWLTTNQLKGWSSVANEGLYGQSGINEIMAGGNQEQALTRAKALKNYYLTNYSKRLGMRAGGQASNDYMNQYVAPLMLENLKKRQALIEENLKSRGYGMEQIDKIMQMIMSGGRGTIQDTSGGGGWTDWIAPIASLVDMVPGIGKAASTIAKIF